MFRHLSLLRPFRNPPFITPRRVYPSSRRPLSHLSFPWPLQRTPTMARGMASLSQSSSSASSSSDSDSDSDSYSYSYSKGPTSPPLLEQTIPAHFDGVVAEYGDRTAVVSRHQNRRLTYYELQKESIALAWGLKESGVEKGMRVGVSLGNSREYAVATYAIYRLGAILVPLNPAFTAVQLTAALNHLSASHLIIGCDTHLPYRPPRSNHDLLQHLIADPHSKSLTSSSVPSLKKIILVDNTTTSSSSPFNSTSDPSSISPLSHLRPLTPFKDLFHPFTSQTSPPPLHSPLHPTEIINIQFTSGTTSRPKAASLTHLSLLNNGHSIGTRLNLTPTSTIVCPPPLFHCFGCVLGYLASASHGACIVFPSYAFDPLASLLAVQEERATALYGVPTMFLAELELLSQGKVRKGEGFEKMKTGIAAGTNVPGELMRRLQREMNLDELTICYGMTETSPVSCMTYPDDPLEKRVRSVGRVMPHVEAKIVQRDDRRKVVRRGERGELVVSGYVVMEGYWGEKAKTDEVIEVDAEGKRWMFTGDEAEMDEEGFVTITGRLKDLIIRGGENVQPLEVENCLLACEGVGDVAVVGVKDERYGEVVGAFIVRSGNVGSEGEEEGNGEDGQKGKKLTARDVREWVRSSMAGHLVPKYVFFVRDFPKTGSGKVQKYLLRGQAEELVKKGEGKE